MPRITAVSGSDYISLSYNITFTSGSEDGQTECVNITIVEDILYEVDETFALTLTKADLGVNLENDTTTITITDTDCNAVFACIDLKAKTRPF